MKKEFNFISSSPKKWAISLVCGTFLGLASVVTAQAQTQPVIQQGGFSGPGISSSTVQQAKNMKDDSPVVLKGYIIQNLGNEKYLFKDESGTITVEIDHDEWRGLQVTPSDLVEISGEIDKEWNKIEIDVSQIKKIK